MRGVMREGYSFARFRADLMAGVIVGIVALPLSMALAIASGVPPQHGLYTAIVAGALIAVTGGSRSNVSGPTAAFVVLLAPISARYGLGGLALASAMAGVILLAMGLFKLGRLVSFVPHPVTTGFTAGIAVVIATLQLKDFLGLNFAASGDHYWERVSDIVGALGTYNWPDLAVGGFSLGLLLVWPRITRRVPGPLVAVILGSVVAYLLNTQWEGATVATVGSRFGGIPQQLPVFILPWQEPGADGAPLGLSMDLVRALVGPAFAIAALGAIESLLSAVVADGMAGTKHDPDSELVGQGLGNIVAPFFGGIAATGAIARTATGIRSGGKTPVTAVIHALFVLAAVMALAPILSYLPMASMAALLLIVAWNMSDARHFLHMLRVAPRSDLSVLLVCFGLTVAFDMVIAVSIGIVLAALLFMRRMAEISGARVVAGGTGALREPLPAGVVLYEIAGPLFFGAADKAMGNLAAMAPDVKVVVLDMSAVPTMDVTGLVALESVLRKLNARGVRVIIGGLQAQPQRVMAKAHIVEKPGELRFCTSLDQAIEEAKRAAV
ncbi:MAG: C4-dicarboxylic acid transporter DauA [Planctomycetes bacterium]|nr:C4-dicarboxylic acid transporter DauA [Planctomycetota bacterium]